MDLVNCCFDVCMPQCMPMTFPPLGNTYWGLERLERLLRLPCDVMTSPSTDKHLQAFDSGLPVLAIELDLRLLLAVRLGGGLG